jgi:hypothetical protein
MTAWGLAPYQGLIAPSALLDATPMTNERSIDELVDEFNAQAKTEGRYDGRALPLEAGTP